MLAWDRAWGRLDVRLRRKPVAAHTDHTGDALSAVTLRNLETGDHEIVSARYVLDATELGDLLPLSGCEYVTGAEAQHETNEPQAAPEASPDDVQGFTWCFPVAWDPDVPDGDERYRIPRPAAYDRWRDYVPALSPPWTGRLLDWTYCHPITLEPRAGGLFAPMAPGGKCVAPRKVLNSL